MRRFDPPSHSCPLPPLTTLGDLWRCQCGRLWAVRADIELGGRPVRRWARPRLRSRIRYANCLNYIDWQLVALAAASVAALCALAAADLFGWS